MLVARSFLPLRARRSGRAALLLVLAGLVLGLLTGCGSSIDERLAQARSLQEQGKTKESVAILEDILAEEPDHPEANYRLGLTRIAPEQLPKAIWPLQKAAASDDPIAPEAGTVLANVLMANEDYEAAVSAATAVLAKDPTRLPALLVRAQAYKELNRRDDALKDTAAILAQEPDSYPALLMHTEMLADAGRLPEAEESMRHLYEVARSQVPVKAPNMCVSLSAFLGEKRHDFDGGRKQIQQCLADYPTDPMVVEWAAWYEGEAVGHDAAVAVYKSAVDVAPDVYLLWGLWAEYETEGGRPEEAEKVLRRAADELDTEEAWTQLAHHYVSRGDYEKASDAMEHAFQIGGGDDETTRAQRADLLISVHRYDEAEKLLQDVEGAQRDFLEGRMLMEQGKLEDALARIEKGFKEQPSNPGARYNAGTIAAQLGQWNKALAHFREATRVNPSATDAALRMAEIYLQLGDFVTAKAMADRHGMNRSLSVEARQVAAAALTKMGQYDEAEGAYEALAKASPQSRVQALVGLASVEDARTGPAAAEKRILDAHVDWKSPESTPILVALLGYREALSQWGDALADVDRAIAARGKSPELLALRGNVLLEAGRDAEARKAFEAARDGDPQLGMAIAGLGRIEQRAGHLDQALELLDQAVAVEKPDTGADYAASQVLTAQGRGEEAEARLRDILEKQPGHSAAANDLAWQLVQENRKLGEAEVLARRAVKLDARESTLDTLGAVLLARGKKEAAVKAYRRALEEAPDSAEARYRLALALVATGSRGEALDQLREAVARGGFGEVEQARAEIARLEGDQAEVRQ